MRSLRTDSPLAFALLIAPIALINCSSSAAPQLPERPPASAGHALVYHSGLASVLLVNAGLGGMSSPPSSTKTALWRWTGQRWTVLTADGPPIRNIGGVAYDAARDALVLFGGSYDQNVSYDETWTWSRRDGWRKHDVAGPGRRDHVHMAYDAERQRVVLFGGQIGTSSFPDDTWLWDGVSWTRVAGASPGARVHHAVAYDPGTRRVLVFGGNTPVGQSLGDTWAWNGTSWTQVTPAIAPRSHMAMAMTSRGMILLGGFSTAPAATVLRLDNGAWQADDQPGHPGARYMPAMAYDPVREVTVLFGGGDPANDQLYADTWEYDASTGWRKIN